MLILTEREQVWPKNVKGNSCLTMQSLVAFNKKNGSRTVLGKESRQHFLLKSAKRGHAMGVIFIPIDRPWSSTTMLGFMFFRPETEDFHIKYIYTYYCFCRVKFE